MRYNIEDLKKEYIGKTFNWLTVIDVFSGGKNIGTMFKCICKCGKQFDVAKRKVLSGHTKSCGCYKFSKEYGDYLKQWYNEHQNECKNRSIRIKSYYDKNPEKRVLQSEKFKNLFKNNLELRNKINETTSLIKKEIRINADYSQLIPFIHKDYINKLLNGDIKSEDFIYIKCRVCNKYEYRKMRNIFNFKKSEFRKGVPPICEECKCKFYSSKYEDEIVNYIFEFCSDECIRNSRNIISPQELDLYYPKKKIAIEFNGDYWHSSKFKEKDYHYNKFIKCRENGILLVSIFESEWNNRKDEIKKYLKDLFNNKENKLSFNEDHSLMNNNYPSPNINIKLSLIQEDYYTFNNHNIFTCGYSIL